MIKNAQLVAAVMMLSSQVAKIASQRILMDSKLVVQIVALQCKRIVLHVAIVAVRELCKLLIKLNKDKQINKLELQEVNNNKILLRLNYSNLLLQRLLYHHKILIHFILNRIQYY